MNDPTIRIALLMDVDGTLTPPREAVSEKMARILQGLVVPFHVAAGSDLPLVREQFLDPLWTYGFRGEFDAYVSNGAVRFRCLYGEEQVDIQKLEDFDFRAHLSAGGYESLVGLLRETIRHSDFKLPETIPIIGTQIVDRGSMVNFAPIGRPSGPLTESARERRHRFVAFDRETGFRERLLMVLRKELKTLGEEKNLVVMIGGETSFDIVVAGHDKTKPVRQLLEEGQDRVVFLGDALSGFGNDSVIRAYVENWVGQVPCPVETIEVRGWQDTVGVLIGRGWTKWAD